MTGRRANHGFTLAETLIALWVVSLAMACVLAGFALLSRFEHNVENQTIGRRAAETDLAVVTQAVATGEALSVKAFTGDAHHLEYACGKAMDSRNSPELCTLKWPDNWRASYVSEAGIFQAWPTSEEKIPQPLEALILQDQAGETLGVVRIQAEQARNCQFDTISRTCREGTK